METRTEEREFINQLAKIPILQNVELRKDATSLESMTAFFKQLLIDEQRVLKILFNAKSAVTVRKIRNEYAIGIAEKYPEISVEMPLVAKLRRTKDQSSENILWSMRSFRDRELEAFISYFNKRAPEKAVSYNRIKNILETFERYKITGRRKLMDQRADEVWFLTPSFSKIYFSIVNELDKKGGHNRAHLTEMEERAYILLTMF